MRGTHQRWTSGVCGLVLAACSGGGGGTDSAGETGAGACGELNDWEQMMLDDHNTWRASVDPPAGDMYRVYWDAEIAANAAAWVASCDPGWPHSPDEERSSVGGYEILGENLSYCAGTGCSELPEVTDGSGLGDGDGWWGERADYNWADDSSSGTTSHYTQLASSNVYAIGCATRRCEAPGPGGWDGEWWWTICQYGPRGQAYWVGNRPYEAGAGGLLEPPASVLDAHPGLCKE
ncbi:MAG: hypothetical protein H6713_06750 [Myxococcales bacterium]|nr:hypothetical protein [Myxococcales bacterium]MCB9749693.1 hypothetical protein [Myxococcales bacterium]